MIARSTFDSSLFTKEEINTLEKVKSKFKNIKTKEIVALSHKENAWIKHNKNRDIISYHEVFTLKAIKKKAC